MKLLKTLLLILPLLAGGCESVKRVGRGEKQPRLHMPVPLQLQTNQAIYQLKRSLVSSNQIKVLRVSEEDQIATNAAAVDSNAGGKQSTNMINAYMQIAADSDVEEEFGTVFSQCFYVGEVVIENKSTNELLAYSASLQVNVTYYVAEKDWPIVSTNLIRRFGDEYIRSVRRPATYSDILAIFEYQKKENPRQRIFDYFESAGEIAAGATVFVGGALYPKAVAFATGIVKPELQKRLLWDVLLHSKNLESRSLKEVEEIAGNASIHKVVFFPKRGVPGILDGCPVYISSFKPYMPIVISGSFINKVAPASSGTIRAQPVEN